MKFKTSETLTEGQVQQGLQLVVKDGLTAEAMTTLTGGAFLMALAVQLGATNFQIGLLAALPTFTNIFQLVSIWLVQRYNNRRAVLVICSFLARMPLFLIALLPFLFSTGTSIQALIFLLFFHYLFGSIAGASWHSWMKDLVPQHMLGAYFSRRGRLMQTLNVVLSLTLALSMDLIKRSYPQYELPAYAVLFFAGGIVGMIGVYFVSRTPEPASHLPKENVFKLFIRPLQNTNFRRLLVFQSAWSFALNIATPFFTVYMMKTLQLPLSYIIGFGLLSQLSSICSIQWWGRHTDRYSNKTIIHIAAPLYIFSILAWTFTAVATTPALAVLMLAIIHITSGVSAAGFNLAITNIGVKLAPKSEAIVYISARNITIAFISALGPLLGGWLADFFTTHQALWSHTSKAHTLQFQSWNFLFLMGGVLAVLSLPLLKKVTEEGEVEKRVALLHMKQSIKQAWNRPTDVAFLKNSLTHTAAQRAMRLGWVAALGFIKGKRF